MVLPFHKTSVALSVKKAEDAVITYFEQILDGAEFTYVCKKKKTDHSLQIDQLQREISKLAMREGRIKEAYEAGVDTLERRTSWFPSNSTPFQTTVPQ